MIVLHDVDRARPLVKTAQRILVIGCSGSGKSTLSQQLSRRLELPYVSCDRDIFWLPGWKARQRGEVLERMQFFVSEERWIIDGNSPSTLPIRLARTDMIIWLRPPKLVCLWGVISRWARFRGQTRPEMAEGCPEKIDLEFFRYVWTYRRQQRPKLLDYFQGLRADQSLVCFTDRTQASDYLNEIALKPNRASIH